MRRDILPAAMLIGSLAFLVAANAMSHQPPPAPAYDDAAFRSFAIPTPSPTPMPTAGAMDVLLDRVSITPAPTVEPAATPWPTHPPKPKLAGGPYKPWRQFSANVLAARAFLNSVLSDTSFRCIDILFDRESRWRVHAGNRTSGAYGIPQALPGKKMAKFGDDWRDNAITQVKWGLYYIRGRYGNPCVALDHSYRTGWY